MEVSRVEVDLHVVRSASNCGVSLFCIDHRVSPVAGLSLVLLHRCQIIILRELVVAGDACFVGDRRNSGGVGRFAALS